jgi:excisionase family DNA binding protein
VRSGWGRAFNDATVRRIREQYGLKNRYERLRERGLLTLEEIAQRLEVSAGTIKRWRRAGLLQAHSFDRREYLFESPDADVPIKHRHKGLTRALAAARAASSSTPD